MPPARPERSPPTVALQRQLLLIGLPALAALIVFVASAAYFSDAAQLDVRRRVLDAEAHAMRHALRAQLMVNDAASAARALAAIVPVTTRPGDLDAVAEQLVVGHPAVSTLEVAHGAEQRRWSASADGYSVRAEGSVTLGGPAQLVAAGQPIARFDQGRIVVTLSLHQRHGGDLARWGQVQAAIGLDRLMRTLALGELLRAGYPVQLLVINAEGDQVGQIAGSSSELAGAREELVKLPDGGALILRVGPRGGLSPDPLLYAQLALSAVAALLLAIIVHVVLRRPGTPSLAAATAKDLSDNVAVLGIERRPPTAGRARAVPAERPEAMPAPHRRTAVREAMR